VHRMLSWIAAIAVLTSTVPAKAADSVAGWVRLPTDAETGQAWPTRGPHTALGGQARILCVLTAEAVLRDCRVIFETPPGAGFGAAAMSLIPRFHLKPATHEGAPVGSSVVIPVAFDMPAWPRRGPGASDLLAAWPREAFRRGTGGVVWLHCLTTAQGGVNQCRVASETPAGQGFGAAALSLARTIAVTPAGHLGRAVDGEVDLPVAFANPDWVGSTTWLPWEPRDAPASLLDWLLRAGFAVLLLGGLAQLARGRPFPRGTNPILHWGFATALSVGLSVLVMVDLFAVSRAVAGILAGPG